MANRARTVATGDGGRLGPTVYCQSEYSSGSCYRDTLLIYPDKLDCGIPAADGLDNSFRIYRMKRHFIPKNTLAHPARSRLRVADGRYGDAPKGKHPARFPGRRGRCLGEA
jgi:hypothetical protein